jgi:Helix-turn-helix.
MKGEIVKEMLKRNGIALNDLAEKLGESPQNLQSMLRASDIKTGVLERIAEAINKNLCFFYNEIQTSDGNNNTAIQGNGNHINSETTEFLSLLKKKDEQIDRLLSIIEKTSN